jgi:hypothetical protein
MNEILKDTLWRETPSGHSFRIGSMHNCGVSDCPANTKESKKKTIQVYDPVKQEFNIYDYDL